MAAVGLNKGDTIKIGDSIVGEVTEEGIVELHLGWLRLAGAGLIVYGDKNDPRRIALRRVGKGSDEQDDSTL